MVEVEEWKSIAEFPGYSVSSLGRVRRDDSGRILVPRYNEYGVAYVGIMRGWEQCSRSLARLVALAFLPIPSEFFNTPIQLDGDPANCSVENLMWRPRDYAVKYKRQFKDRYPVQINEPIRAVNSKEEFPNSFQAGCRYGLLEKEVVGSILHRTPAWPTYQHFERVNMA